MQHLKKYINSESVLTPIKIKLRNTWNWLYKLGFEYKNVKKDIFINEHKQPDVVQDYQTFLKVIKELKSYLVEFNQDRIMKAKEYLSNYAIEGANHQLVIRIIYDKDIFSVNNDIQRAWIRKGNSFL